MPALREGTSDLAKAAVQFLMQGLRMLRCYTQIGKIDAGCTIAERLFTVQLSAVFLGKRKQAFRPSHSSVHSECRLLCSLPWHLI